MAVSEEMLGLALLGGLFVLILVGFPIAFTLLFVAVIAGYSGIGMRALNLMITQIERTMEMNTLAAIPLFVMMGLVLERAGLMERLFHAFQLMFARLRGSLYLAVLSTSTLFAMATGIVGASVTVIGLMAGRMMEKSGYDVRLSAGAIAAGGTLGILIPPSIMLIVLGPIIGVPVLRLFAAVIFPGLLLASLFIGYCLIRSYLNPQLGPPLPEEQRAPNLRFILKEFALGVIPLLVVIAATLGSILAGLATPTEAAGMGALGALLLALGYRKLTWRGFGQALTQTLRISSMVLFLIAAANYFGAIFSILGTPFMVTDWLLDLGLTPFMLLVLILVIVFLLGWSLDWAPIVLILIPVVFPVVRELGINPIWFGALVAVCLQTAWLTPPVALSAYFLKGVMPHWQLKDIYIGMMHFLGLQLIGLSLVLAFPQIALWLPSVLFGAR